MAWCVETLKIIGEGKVEKSSLCNFEFDAAYFEDYLIIDKEKNEIIRIALFPQAIFEASFLGLINEQYKVHFIKFRDGLIKGIDDIDILLIAKKYKEHTENNLVVIPKIQ